jgi:hypothetical protein
VTAMVNFSSMKITPLRNILLNSPILTVGLEMDPNAGVNRKPRAPKKTGIEELIGARPIVAIGETPPYNIWEDLHKRKPQPDLTYPQLINISPTVRALTTFVDADQLSPRPTSHR